MTLEAILSMIPSFAGPYSFIKILFRYKVASKNRNENDTLDIHPWGFNGVAI